MVKGDLYTLAAAYVRGEGITAAAKAAGMSVNTARTRLKSEDGQRLLYELRSELRAELGEWPLRVRALGERVLDAMADVLDGEPDAATVATLARIILPETRYLLSDVRPLPEPKQTSVDAREELKRKLGLMEDRAREVLESRLISDDMKRSLGIVPHHTERN